MTSPPPSLPPLDRARLVTVMREAALEAGRRILEIYRQPFETIRKADGSPVTAADHAAEAVILERLGAAFPDLQVVSEENAASHALAPPRRFVLVDPLDGTKEFVSRNGEFTVNIALIEDGVPVLGAVYAPVPDLYYEVDAEGYAVEEAAGVRRRIVARPASPEGLTAAVSRSHLDAETTAYLARYRIVREISAGSSLKFCLIARGDADIYPRLGGTNEWDTAAGDAVLRAAGGRMTTPEGEPFRYAKPGYRNGPYVAFGKAG